VHAVLKAAEIQDIGRGFHRLVFNFEGGRTGAQRVTVNISQDAYRKVIDQMMRAGVHRLDKESLLKRWARWELALRRDREGPLPDTLTLNSSDVDDMGLYAMDLARTLAVA